jgi:hypothetical protein
MNFNHQKFENLDGHNKVRSQIASYKYVSQNNFGSHFTVTSVNKDFVTSYF